MVSPGRAVRAIELLAPAGAVARLQPLPRAGMLASDPEPGFVLDPVVLDAAGQVIGFWAADRLERGKVVFPFRLAALDVFGPPPVPGETLSCVASIALSGDALVRSDIDVLDAGRRALDASDGLGGQALRRAGPLPGAHCPVRAAAACRLLAGARGAAAPASRLPARRLDARLPPTAACGSRSGRAASSAAVSASASRPRGSRGASARVAGRTHGRQGGRRRPPARPLTDSTCCPPTIEILPGADGAPVVDAPGLERLSVAPVVSLAHAQGEAVALAALVPQGGADGCRRRRHRAPPAALARGFAEAALRADERGAARAAAGRARRGVAAALLVREGGGRQGGRLRAGARAARAHRRSAFDRPRRRSGGRDAGERQLLVHTHRDGELIVATTVSMPQARGGQTDDVGSTPRCWTGVLEHA